MSVARRSCPILLFLFPVSAHAACTAPSSATYVGGGAGPVFLTNTSVEPPTSASGGAAYTLILNFGAATSATIPAGTFSFTGKLVNNSGVNSSGVGVLQYTNGTLNPQTIVSAYGPVGTPTSQVSANIFNKTACTGILTLSGVVYGKAAGPLAAPNAAYSSMGPWTYTFQYSVGLLGSRITLTNFSDDLSIFSFPIVLYRQ